MAFERKFNNIQILRFWAAFSVVLVHWEPDPSGVFFNITPLAPGAFGVDIFFVISGFVMAHTVLSAQTTPFSFFKRRLWRIVPLYWLLTFSVFLVAIVAPNMLKATSSDPIELLKSLAFIPFIKANGLVQPTLFVGWSLNYEMFFYACFAIALYSSHAIGFLTVAFIFLVAAGLFLPFDNVLWDFYSSPMLLEFLAGLWLRVYVKEIANIGASIPRGFIFMAITVALLFNGLLNIIDINGTYRVLLNTPLAAFIVGAVVSLPEGNSPLYRANVKLGETSYACYLSHFFILKLVLVLIPITSFVSALGVTAFAFVLVILVSFTLHEFFEKPSIRFLKHKFGP